MQAVSANQIQQEKPYETVIQLELIRIVDELKLRHEIRTMTEESLRKSLVALDIPLADANGQFILINSEADIDLKDIRVLPEDIEKVQKAFSNALESRGLSAVRDIRKRVIQIVVAPTESAHESIGYNDFV